MNVSMIDYLILVQLYIYICCVGEGFNIASVHVLCPIPFHINEIKYV